jgi:hypothetical protein
MLPPPVNPAAGTPLGLARSCSRGVVPAASKACISALDPAGHFSTRGLLAGVNRADNLPRSPTRPGVLDHDAQPKPYAVPLVVFTILCAILRGRRPGRSLL